MDRTEAALRKLLNALSSPGYDIGILAEERMQRVEALSFHPQRRCVLFVVSGHLRKGLLRNHPFH